MESTIRLEEFSQKEIKGILFLITLICSLLLISTSFFRLPTILLPLCDNRTMKYGFRQCTNISGPHSYDEMLALTPGMLYTCIYYLHDLQEFNREISFSGLKSTYDNLTLDISFLSATIDYNDNVFIGNRQQGFPEPLESSTDVAIYSTDMNVTVHFQWTQQWKEALINCNAEKKTPEDCLINLSVVDAGGRVWFLSVFRWMMFIFVVTVAVITCLQFKKSPVAMIPEQRWAIAGIMVAIIANNPAIPVCNLGFLSDEYCCAITLLIPNYCTVAFTVICLTFLDSFVYQCTRRGNWLGREQNSNLGRVSHDIANGVLEYLATLLCLDLWLCCAFGGEIYRCMVPKKKSKKEEKQRLDKMGDARSQEDEHHVVCEGCFPGECSRPSRLAFYLPKFLLFSTGIVGMYYSYSDPYCLDAGLKALPEAKSFLLAWEIMLAIRYVGCSIRSIRKLSKMTYFSNRFKQLTFRVYQAFVAVFIISYGLYGLIVILLKVEFTVSAVNPGPVSLSVSFAIICWMYLPPKVKSGSKVQIDNLESSQRPAVHHVLQQFCAETALLAMRMSSEAYFSPSWRSTRDVDDKILNVDYFGQELVAFVSDLDRKTHAFVAKSQKLRCIKRENRTSATEVELETSSVDGDRPGYTARRRIVVAFRGTANTENIKLDLNAIRMPLPHTIVPNTLLATIRPLIHVGFYRGYENIGQSIKHALKVLVETEEQKNRAVDILITGHSLGGAMATLCALETASWIDHNKHTLSMYNFGAPRVGNRTFALIYNAMVPTSYRIVNIKDPIPRFPKFMIAFKHIGTEVWLGSRYILVDPSFIEKAFKAAATDLNSHRTSTYLQSLRRNFVDSLSSMANNVGSELDDPPREQTREEQEETAGSNNNDNNEDNNEDNNKQDEGIAEEQGLVPEVQSQPKLKVTEKTEDNGDEDRDDFSVISASNLTVDSSITGTNRPTTAISEDDEFAVAVAQSLGNSHRAFTLFRTSKT